jgi:hypothetical protein
VTAVLSSAIGADLVTGVGVASAAPTTTTASCGYGSGGPEAGTLCWLDMSNYSESAAEAAGGQQMSVTLPGGDIVSFTVTNTPVGTRGFSAVYAHAFPTYSGAYIGNRAYTGTPGKPAFYQTTDGGTDQVTLSGISVTDADDNPVSSYGFVVADAEASSSSEKIIFSSDQDLSSIGGAETSGATTYHYCGTEFSGVGSTTVTCVGNSAPYGAAVLQADTPTTISAQLYGGGLEGVAFAVVTSKVSVTDDVVSRANSSDSFDVSATDPSGSVLNSASTGPAPSTTATTGTITVLPTSSGAYTLAQVATPGSGTVLSNYIVSWSCTDNGTAYPVTPSADGTTASVVPVPGDDIACTVTDTADPPADLGITKTGPATVIPGAPINWTLDVHNYGPYADNSFTVSDPVPTSVTAVATTTPGCSVAANTVTCTEGPLADGADQVITVTGTAPTATSGGSVVNTASITSSSNPDPNSANNQASSTTVVEAPVTVGGVVYHDSNGNGTQDSGEPGISGVTVTLATTSGGAVTDFDGNPVGPQVTNASGDYDFTNLSPGQYVVDVASSQTALSGAGYTPDSANKGSVTTPVIASGGSDAAVDFGYVKYIDACLGTGLSLGTLVFGQTTTPDSPCTNDPANLINIHQTFAPNLGLLSSQEPSVTVSALTGATETAAGSAAAQADLASVTISVPTLALTIQITGLESSAQASVPGGGCTTVLSGFSQIGTLTIDGIAIPVGTTSLTVPFGLGTLSLNQRTTTSNSITETALSLNSPLIPALDLTIGQSFAQEGCD